MADSAMTFTWECQHMHIKRVVCTWLSDDALGTASFTTDRTIHGFLLKGVTNPDAGATQPDDNYNIVLTDSDGANILAGCDADLTLRDETTSETVDFVVATATGARPCVSGPITVDVDSAGNANGGTLTLYWIEA